ncbi:hypothetical protein [uncultured Massilia sp.]|uniref:hypothetical protein n=1 Tax=uncultured Massilia sp. TaxID=169973 RepID=UPI0025F6F8F0|nr:hypothetical protein [uncultured Massilia sp.]
MKLTMLSIRSIAAACALCAVATVPAVAAQQQTAKKPGDPARWYQGNKNQQQSLSTIKKEINAAYAQQKAECGRGAKSERASCLEQARQVYRDDMANAKQLVAEAPSGSVSERVVSTTAAPDPADAGATAVGGSQGGATSSGGAGVADATPRSLDEGAAATGNSGTGISASGSGETGATGSSSTGATDAGTGTGPQPIAPQPMQPPPLVTPPRSEDTPIQR